METASATIARELNATAPGPGQNVCRHYWLIESPNGQASTGKCRYCHAEREFQNSLRDDSTVEKHQTDESIRPVTPPLLREARKPIA